MKTLIGFVLLIASLIVRADDLDTSYSHPDRALDRQQQDLGDPPTHDSSNQADEVGRIDRYGERDDPDTTGPNDGSSAHRPRQSEPSHIGQRDGYEERDDPDTTGANGGSSAHRPPHLESGRIEPVYTVFPSQAARVIKAVIAFTTLVDEFVKEDSKEESTSNPKESTTADPAPSPNAPDDVTDQLEKGIEDLEGLNDSNATN